MSDVVTHKAKTGPLLTGTEYEAADAHDPHDHDAAYDAIGDASAAITTHEAAVDPHTGYRKESDDHTHASTGAQAGKLAQANTHESPDTDAAAGSLHHTVGTSATQAAAGNHTHTGNAPDSVDYLVGTATAGLSAEIVVGTSPGGELGGTWASPTVDATHSGSTHTAATTTHEAAADPHTGYVLESLLDAKGDIIAASADNTPAKVTVGADDTILMADSAAAAGVKWVASASPSAVGTAAATGTADTFTRGDHVHAHETAHVAHDTIFDAKGDLVAGTAADTAAALTVGANDTILMADSAQTTGLKWVASATPSDVGTANAAGTADTFTRGDHVHAHEAAHINHDTTWAAKGDLIAATANDAASVLGVGTNDQTLVAASGQSTGLQWQGGAWTDYTPSLTAVTTNPTLGSSTLTGRFKLLNSKTGIFIINFSVTTGGAWNAGSGEWKFSLPAGWTGNSFRQHVSAHVLDSGTTHFSCTGEIAASGTVVWPILVGDAAGSKVVANAVPVTWATGDQVDIQGIIELA